MPMSDSGPKRIGLNVEVKPHAYDPATQPELFEGVLARRVVAFCIDIIVIAVPLIFVAIFIFMFGLVTLGLGWFLFLFYGPIAVIWALVYYGMTFGSPASATIGMRMVDLEMRTWYGAPCSSSLARCTRSRSGSPCRSSRRSSCWSHCSTTADGWSTTSCWARL